MASQTVFDAEGDFTEIKTCRTTLQIDRLIDPNPAFFKSEYLEKGRPVIVALSAAHRPGQSLWDFERLVDLVKQSPVPVYDWGETGPTTEDKFVITQMPFDRALSHTRTVHSPESQRYSICQLPIENYAQLQGDYRVPDFLSQAEPGESTLPALFREAPRDALFVSFFRGIHFHNGREALAQLAEGHKRFVLFAPHDTRHLYPKRFWANPLAWFDETEAVFCSEIPFEKGLDVDLARFPRFANAQPFIADVRAGEMLFIPTHWWHFTIASQPSVVVVRFWDSPLRRWAFPLAWRSVLMKPYRKYLFRHLRKLRLFSRTKV